MNENEGEKTDPSEIHVTTQERARLEKETGPWQMPEPVYRQTSGYLPKGFEKQFPQAAGDEGDIIEKLAAQQPLPPVTATPSYGRLFILIGVLLGVGAVAALLIFAAYYFLFASRAAETTF